MPRPYTPKQAVNAANTLSTAQRDRIVAIAGKATAGAIVSEMARETLTPAVWNQTITEAHLELILVRIAAGSTLRAICAELGVSSGAVKQRRYSDPVFDEKMRVARIEAGEAMFEMMIDLAFDDTKPVAERRLQIEVLDRAARTFNRALSDRQTIDVRTATVYVLPENADDF